MGKSQKTYMSIKSKLMAAVAMLLVASFMVVSSTYAWFTLSTAPEVTGIKTTIGANGSLEIALAWNDSTTEAFNKEAVTSGVGDSGNYETWGNLVDLKEAKYGMDAVTLLPARLNITGDTENAYLGSAPLRTPVYGADGRVSSLEDATVFGVYDTATSKFAANTLASGLRAIGTASSMTPQQTAYRNSKAAIGTYRSLAQTKASNSLNENGSALASVIASYATGTATEYDLSCMGPMLATLGESYTALENSFKEFFKAELASRMGGEDAVTYSAAADALATLELSAIFDTENTTVDVGGYSFNTITSGAAYEAYQKLASIGDAITKAQSSFDAIGDEEAQKKATADQMQQVLVTSGLMKIDSVTINGLTKTQIRAEASDNGTPDDTSDDTPSGFDQLAQAVINGGQGVIVELPSGSGAYSDIAELAGNYRSAVVIEKISYGGNSLSNVNATMATKVTTVINIASVLSGAPSGTSAEGDNITDFYGYAVDLVFRTNAFNSSLMLQTTPEQRIYSESTNQQTQGQGSTMSFVPTTNDFTVAQVQSLMKAIRIVFTANEAVGDSVQTKVVAVACLDVENVTINAEGAYTASIKLVNYTLEADSLDNDNKGYQLLKITTTTDTDGNTVFDFKDNEAKDTTNDFAQKLMALNQNEATLLSALVYLDGDMVTNADVANAASSMTGTLNLQFSSDATLVPMQNTPLEQGSAE